MNTLTDIVVRIRNGVRNNKNKIIVPKTKLSLSILELLYKEGYISGYKILEKSVEVWLKVTYGQQVIKQIVLSSKPGKHTYLTIAELFHYGYGTMILSTSKGIITHQEAIKLCIGGEILFHIM